jgi:succinate dehydrogenase / fumarate reductase, membrane anchor subunit
VSAPAAEARAKSRRHASGVHHWWVQRVTSVILIPLGIWFAVSMFALPAHDYFTVVAWLGQKWTAVLLDVLIALSAWHSLLGWQIVLEDYVANGRTFWLLVSRLAHSLVALVSILAVLRIAFGSHA